MAANSLYERTLSVLLLFYNKEINYEKLINNWMYTCLHLYSLLKQCNPLTLENELGLIKILECPLECSYSFFLLQKNIYIIFYGAIPI